MASGWAHHSDLGILRMRGQGLPFACQSEAAALVQAPGWIVGLGHPEVHEVVAFVVGPLQDRLDEGTADALPARLRMHPHRHQFGSVRQGLKRPDDSGWC